MVASVAHATTLTSDAIEFDSSWLALDGDVCGLLRLLLLLLELLLLAPITPLLSDMVVVWQRASDQANDLDEQHDRDLDDTDELDIDLMDLAPSVPSSVTQSIRLNRILN